MSIAITANSTIREYPSEGADRAFGTFDTTGSSK
jgi:hypothetical protein